MTVVVKNRTEKMKSKAFEQSSGKYVCVGTPDKYDFSKDYFYYGTLVHISPKRIVLRTRLGERVAIEKIHIKFIREARKPRGM